MSFKWVPFLSTALLTAALLFGGWFVYRHYGVEQPLDRLAEQTPGVIQAEAEMGTDEVRLRLRLEPDADLAAITRHIRTDGQGTIGDRELHIEPVTETSEKLETAWQSVLFEVAEAMENRRYSGIRDALGRLEKEFPGIQATAQMDEQNVYIHLRDGETAKFVVLPRQPVTLGVWPHA
jgi:hypothetical protein